VFNEEQAVPTFLERIGVIAQDLAGRIARLEVVFVDDGSTDATVARILEHPANGFDIRLVRLSRNFCKDNALSAGLAHARGDAVIPIDVDLQDPPELIPKMVDKWRAGAKVVNARRVSRAQDSAFKRKTSGWFYRVFNRLSDYTVDPDVGDFRLLDRKAVDILNGMPERVRFMKGLFAWIGFQPAIVEYERPSRAAGSTKWNVWRLWNFALDGITGTSTLPLRLWSYFGAVIATAAILYAIFLLARTAIYGVDVPGYASLMVVVLFLGACNLIALGVFGEYMGRLTIEARQRPIYVVDEVIDREGGEVVPNERTTESISVVVQKSGLGRTDEGLAG